MMIIDWLHVAASLAFFIAACVKIKQRQGEHFFTRFLIGTWFGLTVWDRSMPVEFVRTFSNIIVIILPIIEIISDRLRAKYRRS